MCSSGTHLFVFDGNETSAALWTFNIATVSWTAQFFSAAR